MTTPKPFLKYYASVTAAALDHVDVFTTHANPVDSAWNGEPVYISTIEAISDLLECSLSRAERIWKMMLKFNASDHMEVIRDVQVRVFPKKSKTKKRGYRNRYENNEFTRDVVNFGDIPTLFSYAVTMGKHADRQFGRDDDVCDSHLVFWKPAILAAQERAQRALKHDALTRAEAEVDEADARDYDADEAEAEAACDAEADADDQEDDAVEVAAGALQGFEDAVTNMSKRISDAEVRTEDTCDQLQFTLQEEIDRVNARISAFETQNRDTLAQLQENQSSNNDLVYSQIDSLFHEIEMLTDRVNAVETAGVDVSTNTTTLPSAYLPNSHHFVPIKEEVVTPVKRPVVAPAVVDNYVDSDDEPLCNLLLTKQNNAATFKKSNSKKHRKA